MKDMTAAMEALSEQHVAERMSKNASVIASWASEFFARPPGEPYVDAVKIEKLCDSYGDMTICLRMILEEMRRP